jgi:catechol 2,3-dioxygenase-like lactoylglutathione lyase family enzyme
MATFLHTMVRITDPQKSRAFYEALGFSFASEMDIVRDGRVEATNYFSARAALASASSRIRTATGSS